MSGESHGHFQMVRERRDSLGVISQAEPRRRGNPCTDSWMIPTSMWSVWYWIHLGEGGHRDDIPPILSKIETSHNWYEQWYAYRALRRLGWSQGKSR
jgi:hypothetical protein